MRANKFIDEVHSRGYKPLEDLIITYKNSSTKYLLECPEGHEWEVTPANFKRNGSCKTCGYKKTRMNLQVVRDAFIERNFTPLFEDEEYQNNTSKLRYVCNAHSDKTQYIDYGSLSKGRHGCKYCFIERVSGEFSYRWKGGESELYDFLRKKSGAWKKRSMESCDYKCIITGEKFEVIHHIVGFNTLVRKSLTDNSLDYKEKLSQYTSKELNLIVEKFLELQDEFLGVCLLRSIHNLFHLKYGFGDNTYEQFEEFKELCQKGIINYKESVE